MECSEALRENLKENYDLYRLCMVYRLNNYGSNCWREFKLSYNGLKIEYRGGTAIPKSGSEMPEHVLKALEKEYKANNTERASFTLERTKFRGYEKDIFNKIYNTLSDNPSGYKFILQNPQVGLATSSSDCVMKVFLKEFLLDFKTLHILYDGKEYGISWQNTKSENNEDSVYVTCNAVGVLAEKLRTAIFDKVCSMALRTVYKDVLLERESFRRVAELLKEPEGGWYFCPEDGFIYNNEVYNKPIYGYRHEDGCVFVNDAYLCDIASFVRRVKLDGLFCEAYKGDTCMCMWEDSFGPKPLNSKLPVFDSESDSDEPVNRFLESFEVGSYFENSFIKYLKEEGIRYTKSSVNEIVNLLVYTGILDSDSVVRMKDYFSSDK